MWFIRQNGLIEVFNRSDERTPMTAYLTGATITFSILLNAFLKDTSTPKTHLLSWLVLLIATLLWFVTLPCVIRKQWLAANTTSSLSTDP